MKFNFQLVFLIFFIAAAIFGILVFSGAIPIGSNSQSGALGTVVLWGTVPAEIISTPLQNFNDTHPTFVVKYVQKSGTTFDHDLLEALASGTGPDMFLMSDNLAYHYANKILAIPYTSYPLSTFKNVFAGAGEVFLTSKGILAFPLSVDPLMMYYNRSILDANGIIYPPSTWDDLTSVTPTLTKKDNTGKITASAVALGDFSNINHAKDILATLFMQGGNPIVKENNGSFSSALNSQIGNFGPASMLKFYTDFADPNQAVYSWNTSIDNSSDAFSNENLAFYFGFASEIKTFISKNPNENFFIAPMPQIKNATSKLTASRVTGLAISSASKNINTAFTAASLMATSNFASDFASATGVAPVRRDLLAVKGADAYSPIIYNSALYARSWLDPSSADTDNIFSGMINSVLSGSISTSDAIKDADSKLNLLLPVNQ